MPLRARSRNGPCGPVDHDCRVRPAGEPSTAPRPSGWPVHLAGLVSCAVWAAVAWRSQDDDDPGKLVWWLAAQGVGWLMLAAVAFLGRGGLGRPAVLGWALCFRLCGLFAEPVLEDDHFRFLWDGRVFAQSGDPYARAPAASFQDPALPVEFQRILDQVNHPHVPTVYGPVCQLGFLLGHQVAPGRLWPWKLLLLAAEIAVVLALRRRLTDRCLLLLAWCPLAVAETAFNVHPDALGVALLVLAGTVRQPWLAGVLAAASGGAKVFGWLLAPFLLARRGRAGWVAFVLTLAALYLPFLQDGGRAEFAGLSAMATGWEFNSSVHAVVSAVLGPTAARGVCLVAFAAVWLAVWRRWRKRSVGTVAPPDTALPGGPVFGAFFLLSATVNPWYLLWLWPFVALRPTWTGLTALAAVSLSYCTGQNLGLAGLGPSDHPVWVRPVEFGLLGLAALVDMRRARPEPV